MAAACSATLACVDTQPPSREFEDATGAAADSASSPVAPLGVPTSTQPSVNPAGVPVPRAEGSLSTPEFVGKGREDAPSVTSPVAMPPPDALTLAPFAPIWPPRQAAQPSKWPMRLAIVIGIVAFLCLGLGAIAFRYYDNATQPDRSSPANVVDNYLRALLVQRDDDSAAEYACKDESGLDTLKALRADIESREKARGGGVSFTWIEGDISTDSAAAATVNVTLTLTVGTAEREFDTWVFHVAREGAWCVSSAMSTQ